MLRVEVFLDIYIYSVVYSDSMHTNGCVNMIAGICVKD